MDIFESLENLNVSEECFDDIMDIVEEYINELKNSTIEKTLDAHWDRITNNKARGKDNPEDTEKYFKSTDRAEERARKKGQVLSKTDKGKHVHSKLASDNGVLHYVRADESLYNEIMDIVEEVINEIDNSTVASMYKKRREIEKKADNMSDYADTVGRTVLSKAKKEKNKEGVKKAREFMEKAHIGSVEATLKRLKAANTIKNWARKMRGVNVSSDDRGNLYVEK